MILQLSVVLPAYNEAARVPEYLEECVEYLDSRFLNGYEVLVVDDGSSDGTGRVVTALGRRNSVVRVVRHDRNRGKGAAVRGGMLAARGRLRLFADADGATPIAEFDRLLRAIQAGADVAIGSRAAAGGIRCFISPKTSTQSADSPVRNDRRHVADAHFDLDRCGADHRPVTDVPVVWRVHRQRHVLGRVFAWCVRRTLGLGIQDTQCGFKLFTDRAAELLFPRMTIDGWLFDVEVLYLASRLGLKVAEVPVNWHDVPGSKVKVFKHGWEMLRGLRSIWKRHENVQPISCGNSPAAPIRSGANREPFQQNES